MPLIKPLKRVDAAYQGFKVVKYWLGISRKSYLFSCCYLFRKTFFIGFNEDLKCFSIPDLRTRIFFYMEINLDFYSIKQYSEILCLIYLTPIQSGLMRKKIIVLYFDTCWYGKLLHKYQNYFFLWICSIYMYEQLDGVLSD